MQLSATKGIDYYKNNGGMADITRNSFDLLMFWNIILNKKKYFQRTLFLHPANQQVRLNWNCAIAAIMQGLATTFVVILPNFRLLFLKYFVEETTAETAYE